jgi:hypothetical protein
MTTTTLVQAGTGSTIQVAGFITVDISGTPYTLSGTVGSAIVVDYHRSFADAANVGTIQSIITSVATALGSTSLGAEVSAALDSVKGVPFLGPVVAVLTTSNVRITDLAINTATRTYQFGFGLDLTGQDIKLGSITLDSFGLVVTSTDPAT